MQDLICNDEIKIIYFSTFLDSRLKDIEHLNEQMI